MVADHAWKFQFLTARKTTFQKPIDELQHDGPDDILNRKRKRPMSHNDVQALNLDLEEYGHLVARAPSRANQDIQVLYTQDNMNVFINYMLGMGIECNPQRREYRSKSSKEDAGKPAS